METVLGIIMAPINLIKEDRRLSSELRRGLRSIKQELEMIKADMENYDELQVQELAYDIEDFMHGIWIPGASGPILTAIGMDPRDEHLERIRGFKESIERLEKRQHQSPQPRQSRGSPAQGKYAREEELVGIDKPKREILELLVLSPASGGQHPAEQQKLKVISILGCRGVGKTALARAVHDDPDVRRAFGCVAWVVASGCNQVDDLLDEALKVTPRAEAGGATSANLHDNLADKRYLVFIDDVQQPELLQHILHAFPENGMSSRIIVTTSVRSVAASSSSGSYVYTMQCLDKLNSENLFWRKVYGCERNPNPALVCGSESVFIKCNGLPLALIIIADHLSKKRNILKKCDCEKAGQAFGRDYLTDNKIDSAFGALTQCYDSLPDYDHKNCMLSLSIFPQGHQINSKSLVRRLVAEGLVAGDARKCYEELVDRSIVELDRSIVEPLLTGNYSKDAARCHVHGIMLEYIIQKSVSKNFVALIGEPPLRTLGSTVARVRRVAVHSGPKEIFDEVADKSAIRSLTMFNSKPFDFQSCKMMRLLDLEGCSGLDRRFLDGICELILLKYLSLRKSDVDMLPTKIEKLQHLETLDVRETRVQKLPVEVIMLPKLAYLFGKFELPEVPKQTSKLEEFLTKKSVLHTIAGFDVNQAQVINGVILKARKLKKVKVWCNDPDSAPSVSSTPTRKRKCLGLDISQFLQPTRSDHSAPILHAPLEGNDMKKLVSSLQKRFTALDSVSIDSNNGLCKDFLASLRGPCTIRSIKLRGPLDSLPDSSTLSELCNLTKLQLFSTGLSSENLSILQSLPCLEYLKLAEHHPGFWEGNFVVEHGGFQSLHQLCFEAPKLPKLHFQHGALASLLSLQLLRPYSCQVQESEEIEDNLGVEGISLLEKLSEVILAYSVGDTKMRAWKSVANGHPNRPSVKKQPGPPNNTTA